MESSSNPRLAERTTATNECLISPKNNDDPAVVQRLESDLKGMTGFSRIYFSPDETNKVKWWVVDLTDEQLEKLRKDPDVGFADQTLASKSPRNISHVDQAPVIGSVFPANSRFRRDDKGGFDRQTGAPMELSMISVPPEQEDMCAFKDYVYDALAGEGVRIFHIEDGIPPGLDEEFPPDRVVQKPLRTPRYHWLAENAEPPNDHSVCVASKAMGTNFGAAKKSTLAPVLRGDDKWSSITESLLEIKKNLTQERSKRDASLPHDIVILSKTVVKPYSEIKDRTDVKESYKYIADLFDMGVPMIAAAGNHAHESPTVNLVPVIWASDEFPLIVVGNANYEGEIDEDSQVGDQVALYACGTDVSCQGVDEEIIESGTSFAAPIVAGVLATFMAQKSGPFFEATKGATGLDYVKKARRFLIDKANQERVEGVKLVWNLVTLEHNEPSEESDAWLDD